MCEFSEVTTTPIMIFEGVIAAGTAFAIWYLPRLINDVLRRYAIIATAVLLFEIFTSPMWVNANLGPWAYLYKDISWILTIGWSTMILSVVVLIDHHFASRSVRWRFAGYLVCLTVIVIICEYAVLKLGVRSYSPEVTNTLIGVAIGGVPIEVLYYVPVFMSLIICFYKFWALYLDDELIVPVHRFHWRRNLLISFVGVLLFELMIEPMVVNQNFPNWSYIYNDISILMTGFWMLLIAVIVSAVDRYQIDQNIPLRYATYLILVFVAALPLEAWFINHGYRVYGPSAESDFSGVLMPYFQTPVEVALAIPIYLALVIPFIKYWQIVLNNHD